MILKVKPSIVVPCRFVRALFIRRDNAKDNPPALWPVFDYKNRLNNRVELEENIKRRKLTDKINVNDLYAKWELFKRLEADKKLGEKRRPQIYKIITELNNIQKTSGKKIDDEQQQIFDANLQEARRINDTIKQFQDVYEGFNIDFLALPNKLLPNTPDAEQIDYEFGTRADVQNARNHLCHEHLIRYFNESCYFLENQAANFDLTFPMECIKYFQRHKFQPFCNGDFVKTIVAEGAAEALDQLYEVPHEFHENYTNLVHLVGAGSWLSFIGYIAKFKVDKGLLPLRFVSSGRVYRPPSNDNRFDLFDVAQSTAVHIFLADIEQQINERFDSTLKLIIDIYRSIGIHFRVVRVPSYQLKAAECYAVRIEMYSASRKQYIEVGNLSHYSNYISNRLRFMCEKDSYKPHILCGTICNVTKLLAISLETYDGNIPNCNRIFKMSTKNDAIQ